MKALIVVVLLIGVACTAAAQDIPSNDLHPEDLRADASTPASDEVRLLKTAPAVWTQPVSTVAALALFGMTHVSLGGNLGLRDRYSLVVETAFERGIDPHMGPNCGNGILTYYGFCQPSNQFWLTVGVSVQLVRLSQHFDVFIVPKLVSSLISTGAYTSDARAYPGFFAGSVTVGFDAGIEFVYGFFYAALVVGGSVGACYRCNGFFPSVAYGNNDPRNLAPNLNPDSGVNPAVDLNLNLLRLGVKL